MRFVLLIILPDYSSTARTWGAADVAVKRGMGLLPLRRSRFGPVILLILVLLGRI